MSEFIALLVWVGASFAADPASAPAGSEEAAEPALPELHPRKKRRPAPARFTWPDLPAWDAGVVLGALPLNSTQGVYADASAWVDWRPQSGFFLEGALVHAGFDASDHGVGERVDLRFSVGVEGRLGHFAVGLGGTNVYPADSDCVGNLAEGGTCLPPAPELDLQFGMGGRRRPGFTVRLNAVHFPVYAAGTPPLFENGPDYWLTAVAQGDLVARIGDRQGGLWNLRLSLISKRMANFAVGIDAPMPGGGRGYTALLLGGFAASPVHPGGRGLATGFEFGASFGDPGRAPVSGAPGISLERAFVSVAVDRFVPVVVDAEVRVGGPAWAVAMHGLQVDILGSPTDARQRLLALTVGPQSRWWAFGLGAGASEWRDQSQPTLAAQWRLGRVDATRLYTWFDVAFSTYCAEDRSSQGCPASPVAKPTALSLTLNIPVHPRWELVEALSSNEAALVTLRSGVDFRVHGGNVPVWFGLGLGLERGVPGLNASLRYGG